jgi:hypothetical protein
MGGWCTGAQESPWFLKMAESAAQRFRERFFAVVQDVDFAAPLRYAAHGANLGEWTEALTKAAVATCEAIGWKASAKGHKVQLLPIHRSEYLGLDVMAFPKGEKRWRFPVAAMELENSRREDQIAYSLWKVLSVNAEWRAVFCYRERSEQIPALVRHLREEVVEAMALSGRVGLGGQTTLIVGTRSESETFPYGYFGWWNLDTNTGKFERV